jgi:hypothetical protein
VYDEESLLEAIALVRKSGGLPPNAEDLLAHFSGVGTDYDVEGIADGLAELESLGRLKRAAQADWVDERAGVPKTRVRYRPAE